MYHSTIIAIIVIVIAATREGEAACPGQTLRALPGDPSVEGPYDVGVIETVLPMPTDRDANRQLRTYVYYPAVPGSSTGQSTIVFDLREKLHERYNDSIPDEANPWINCTDVDCFWDLPLDAGYGPYGVHIHIHGTAAWGYASLHQFTHWASRGFVVIAADHPGIYLKDIMTYNPDDKSYIDQTEDAYWLVDQLTSPITHPDFAFLEGHIDITNLAISGHSAGGGALRPMGDVAKILIPMASGGITGGPGNTALLSTLVMGGIDDGIANWNSQVNGYNNAPAPKRLTGVDSTGHHFCTDLCWIGREDGGIAQIAIDHNIPEGALFKFLAEDGCDYYFTGSFLQPDGAVSNNGPFNWDQGTWAPVNFITSAVMEEVLNCNADMTAMAARIREFYPQVADYRQDLNATAANALFLN